MGRFDPSPDPAAAPERTALLAAIVESSDDAIIEKDLDGTIRTWNRAAERMYGYTAQEVVGRSIDIIVPPERRPELRGILGAIARGERVERLQTQRRTKSGALIWVSVTVSPVHGPDGRPLGASAIARDITAERRAQRELARLNRELERRTLELERSNRELDQFASVVSHDLQEPLRMVRSFCRLLEENYADRLDARAREFIGFAVDGATRLQEMVDALLEYARVGNESPRPLPVALETVLGEVEELLAAQIRAEAAVITHGPLPVVAGDGRLLRQVLQNLVSNAIKFHAPGIPPHVRLEAEEDGEMWVIRVRDDGIGIESSQLEAVFDFFRRLHARDVYAGTGLGLAVCRRIVERHGGRIWAESQPGEGSCFAFTVPRVLAEAPDPASPASTG